VRLALTELADSLRDTFFGDYPLDFEILDSLPDDFSFDWYGLMRDVIAPALLTAPHLESTFISRRCEELLGAYQDASSLVYQHELEIHELRSTPLPSAAFFLCHSPLHGSQWWACSTACAGARGSQIIYRGLLSISSGTSPGSADSFECPG
jgi:hypothetical protein